MSSPVPTSTPDRLAARTLQTIPPAVRHWLLLAVFAQIGDTVTFAIGSQMIGIRYEANGLVAAVYRRAGLDGVLLLKGAAILVIVGVLVMLAGRLPRAFLIGAIVAAGLGLLGLVTNTTTVAGLIG